MENDQDVREEPRVMSDEDVKEYHGLTLNEEGETDREFRNEDTYIRVKTFNLSALPWWKKAIGGAIIAGLLLVGLSIASVLFVGGMFVVAAGALCYHFRRFFMN